jgi:hypothetical protein
MSENQKNIYSSSLVKIAEKLEKAEAPMEKMQLKPCSPAASYHLIQYAISAKE